MIFALLFLFTIFGILTNAKLCSEYAYLGLRLWARNMIPSLLPFMILSGIILRMGIAERFAGLFSPLLGRIFRASKAACYAMVIGYLCGFPMGARTVSELYERGLLSEKEARWLLSFCNLIGPAYFCGIVLPLYQIQRPLPYLFGAYGIPLIYGFVLRKTIYAPSEDPCQDPQTKEREGLSFGEALSGAIGSAVQGILILGGYVTFFCLWNALPQFFFLRPIPLLGPLFEITSGILSLQGTHPLYGLVSLTFGGLSCIAQTYASLQQTNLKNTLWEYVLHKIILSALALPYYSFLLSSSFFS